MQFVGKDFLKMAAPKGYKPGIGRGAVPLTTSADSFNDSNFLKRKASEQPNAKSEAERFEDEEAERVYAAIDARRRRKRPKHVEPPPVDLPTSLEKNKALKEVSLEEWANLPAPSDSTRWNKRLRETERMGRRMYAVVPSLSKFETQNEQTGLSEANRPAILDMIRNQPGNEEGYLRLAELEMKGLKPSKARHILERGTRKIPSSERLWIALLDAETLGGARQTAAKACLALPKSEKLWLRAVQVEPTRAMKKQVVHEALLNVSDSTDLWLLAADLESDKDVQHKVLKSAQEFVNSPKLWLKLSEFDPGCLAEARGKFPNNSELLFASLKTDNSVLPQVIEAVPLSSSKWIDFLSSLPSDHELLKLVAPSFNFTDLDALPLDHRHTMYASLAKSSPSPELYLRWAETQPEVLEEAVTAIPTNNDLWLAYFEKANNWPRMLSASPSASPSLLRTIANRLISSSPEKAVEWLSNADLDASLTLLLIEAQKLADPSKVPTLIKASLAKFPDSGELHVLSANYDSQKGKKELEEVANTTQGDDQAAVLNKLASLEPFSTRRRALLIHALSKHPNFGPLWLSRVQLERDEMKPVSHILAEATQRCPKYAPLWLVDLLETPAKQRKRRLAEAVRLSGANPEVLRYGSMYFESLNDTAQAEKWLNRSGLPKLSPNPFL